MQAWSPGGRKSPHLGAQRLRRKVLRIDALAVLQHICGDVPRLGRLLPRLQPVVGLRPAGRIGVLQQRADCLVECLGHAEYRTQTCVGPQRLNNRRSLPLQYNQSPKHCRRCGCHRRCISNTDSNR